MNAVLRSLIELYDADNEQILEDNPSDISVYPHAKIFNRVMVKRFVKIDVAPKCIQDLSSIKRGCRLELFYPNPAKVLVTSDIEKEDEINMRVRAKDESSIETDTLLLPLQVCIGQIALSVQDIIELKHGSVCKMKIPEKKSVQLLLGGEPIAEASLSLNENSVILKIITVHLKLENEKCDNGRDADEVDGVAG